MKEITLGDIMHVYGSFGLHMDYTVRLCLRMADAVDGDILRAAVESAQRRYPYLSVRMRDDGQKLWYEENDAPVALLHTAERISLNAPETNHHVWAVCYWEDFIYLDIYHGIADGAGMYMLLSTLLYYYCHGRYGVTDHRGVRTLDDPIAPEESDDPMEHLPQLDLSKLPKPAMPEVFSLTGDGGMSPADTELWDIAIAEDAFLRFTSANDASPGTMVSLLLARSLDRLYPEREKGICSSYVMNARPMLGAPLSHHNCVSSVMLNYSDRIRAMPFDRQCTAYRGITFVQSDAERVAGVMTVMANRKRAVAQTALTTEAKKQAFAQMLSGGRGRFTFLVSYVGQWKLPALGAYIREFWTHIPQTNDLLVEISAVNGRIFLSIHQSLGDDRVIREFLGELDREGIEYEVCKRMKNDVARFQEASISR